MLTLHSNDVDDWLTEYGLTIWTHCWHGACGIGDRRKLLLKFTCDSDMEAGTAFLVHFVGQSGVFLSRPSQALVRRIQYFQMVNIHVSFFTTKWQYITNDVSHFEIVSESSNIPLCTRVTASQIEFLLDSSHRSCGSDTITRWRSPALEHLSHGWAMSKNTHSVAGYTHVRHPTSISLSYHVSLSNDTVLKKLSQASSIFQTCPPNQHHCYSIFSIISTIMQATLNFLTPIIGRAGLFDHVIEQQMHTAVDISLIIDDRNKF